MKEQVPQTNSLGTCYFHVVRKLALNQANIDWV